MIFFYLNSSTAINHLPANNKDVIDFSHELSFRELLIYYLERHHGAQFPGSSFVLKTILDERRILNNGTYDGLIFFSIVDSNNNMLTSVR